MHVYTDQKFNEDGLKLMNEMFTEIGIINQYVHYPVYMLYSLTAFIINVAKYIKGAKVYFSSWLHWTQYMINFPMCMDRMS